MPSIIVLPPPVIPRLVHVGSTSWCQACYLHCVRILRIVATFLSYINCTRKPTYCWCVGLVLSGLGRSCDLSTLALTVKAAHISYPVMQVALGQTHAYISLMWGPWVFYVYTADHVHLTCAAIADFMLAIMAR